MGEERSAGIEPLLKPREVAAILSVSRSHVYQLISSGQIPSVRVGERTVRVRRSDLEAYIESRVSGGGAR